MSDVAQKTNTSVAELTKTLTALQILGINTDMNSLAKAFQMMEKNTGKSGLSGFYDVVAEIGKIPDAAERGKRAMAVFGRSGLEFMPIINAAKDGTAALEGVINAMRGVSSEVAATGDDIADGMKIVTDHVRSWWFDAIAAIAQKLTGSLPTSFRQSMAICIAYADYYVDSIGDIWAGFTRRISGYFDVFRARDGAAGAAISATWEKLFGSGGSWGDVGQAIANAWNAPFKETEEELEDLDNRAVARAEKLAKDLEAAMNLEKNYNKAVGASWIGEMPTGGAAAAGEAFGTAAAKRISNALIMGGSNQASRLAMLGPQYQNEAKKQTDILAKIYQKMDNIPQELKGPELAVANL